MFNKVKRALLAVALLLGVVGGVGSIGVIEAGATPVACPGGSGGGSWFSTTGGAAVNCSIEGNHIVVDMWGPAGSGANGVGQAVFQGSLDLWYGTGCQFLSAIGSTTAGFRLNFGTPNDGAGCSLYGPAPWFNASTQKWEQVAMHGWGSTYNVTRYMGPSYGCNTGASQANATSPITTRLFGTYGQPVSSSPSYPMGHTRFDFISTPPNGNGQCIGAGGDGVETISMKWSNSTD